MGAGGHSRLHWQAPASRGPRVFRAACKCAADGEGGEGGRKMGPVRRDRPEVAIEWLDVTIDIKVREPFSCKKGDAVSVGVHCDGSIFVQLGEKIGGGQESVLGGLIWHPYTCSS